jgi:uncharacterized protein (DUF1778 family)
MADARRVIVEARRVMIEVEAWRVMLDANDTRADEIEER